MGLISRLIFATCPGNAGGGTCKDSNSQISKSFRGMS